MVCSALSDTLTLFVSLPGLTGQSSTNGRCLPERPVKPGDDSRVRVDPNKEIAFRHVKSRIAAKCVIVGIGGSW
jgi:hypothetical protein